MQVQMNTRGRARRMVTGGLLAVLAAPALLVVNEAVAPVPIAHAAGILDIKPADYFTEFDMPDCGSKNVDTGIANFRNNIGSGSTIFVGQEIVIKAALYNGIIQPSDGNDGPDPLTLNLQPTGYLEQTAPTVAGVWDVPDTTISFGGDGFVGPVAPVGKWGYKFDANSSPKVIPVASADGTDEQITIRFKATAPGDINVQRLEVTGYDATGIDSNVHCNIFVNWFWHVIEMEEPEANIDFIYVDARYSKVNPSDATTGRHTVSIDVLDNDADPNLPDGPNDHNVKLVSWSSNLDCGDPSLNGVNPTAANFDSLAEGPCRYTPEVDSSNDAGSYTMVQRSGLIQASTDVLINQELNNPPEVGDAEEDVLQGGALSGSILDYADDIENDPIVCTPIVDGGFDLKADCSYDFNAPFAPPTIVKDYEICDTHETLSTGQLGDAVRVIDYEKDFPGTDDDLDITHSRRCTLAQITFNLRANAPDLLPPFNLKNIVDVVDTPYLADGNGPYRLRIDTWLAESGPGPLDNATGVNSLTLGFINAAYGTGSVVANRYILFEAGNGWVGPVNFKFTMCAQFGLQQVCKTAKVILTAVGNRRPKLNDDNYGELFKSPYTRFPQYNDGDADLDFIECKTAVTPNPPAAFASVAMAKNCTLSFQGAADYVGPATVEYTLCDINILQAPVWYDQVLGYGPFDVPGPLGRNSLCASATVSMSFVNPPPPVEDPPAGPNNLPVCNDDAFATVQNVSVVGDVLANDSDLDEANLPSPLTLLEADVPASQQGGSIAPEAGKLKYAPAPGFIGVDVAVYDAVDSDGHGCQATVTYTVKGDVDGDGVPNDIDPDIDGDGIPNDQDPDMDGDGVPNGQDPDVDGDGIPNDQDVDSNSDGIADPEPAPPPSMPGPDGTLPSTGTSGSATTGLTSTALVLVAGGFVLVATTRRRRGGPAVRR